MWIPPPEGSGNKTEKKLDFVSGGKSIKEATLKMLRELIELLQEKDVDGNEAMSLVRIFLSVTRAD